MVATLEQRNFSGGEITDRLHGRRDLERYATAVKTSRNVVVTAHGNLRKRAGTEFVQTLSTGQERIRMLPFVFSDEQAYLIVLAATAEGTRGWIHHGGHRVTWPDGSPIVLTLPYTDAELPAVRVAQAGDVMTLVHRDNKPREIHRRAHDDWAVVLPTLPQRVSPKVRELAVAEFPTGDEWRPERDWTWAVACVVRENGVWSEVAGPLQVSKKCGLDPSNHPVKLYWLPPAPAWPAEDLYYRVYRGRNGVFGVVGETEKNEFFDDGGAPNYASGPQAPLEDNSQLLLTEGTHPGAVAYFQQRKVFGGSRSSPSGLWFSQVGNFGQFTAQEYSEPLANEGIAIKLAASRYEQVEHLVPMGALLAFTGAAEWSVEAVNGEALGPRTINAGAHTHRGCGTLAPLVVGNSVLFVSPHGNCVHELAFESAESTRYSSRELSVLARHLLDGHRIVDWAWQEQPDGILWMFREDGRLIGLTYSRENELIAWHQHDIAQGAVKAVACVPEGGYDVLYLAVQRRLVVEGVLKLCLALERIVDLPCDDARAARHLDCATYWSGRNEDPRSIVRVVDYDHDVQADRYSNVRVVTGGQPLFAGWGGPIGASGSSNQLVFERPGEAPCILEMPQGGWVNDTEIICEHFGSSPEPFVSGTSAWTIRRGPVAGLERFEGPLSELGTLTDYRDGAVNEVDPAIGEPAMGPISGGELTNYAFRAGHIAVGYAFRSEIELLDASDQVQGKRKKKLVHLGIDGQFAGTPAFGVALDQELTPEAPEVPPDPYFSSPGPIPLLRRKAGAYVAHGYDDFALGAIRQTGPYPLLLLGAEREVDLGDV